LKLKVFVNLFKRIGLYIIQGAPKDKLVMGMPIYGRGFQLNNTEDNGLYCPAKDGNFITFLFFKSIKQG